MAKNESRNLGDALTAGQTDGRYNKVRMDTTVADEHGNALMEAERGDLNPFYNYGFITREAPVFHRPGSL